MQDSEVGDGTTSVVIIAAELLRRANDLVRSRVHPTSIMAGYRLAMKEAVKYIKSNLTVPADRSQRCVRLPRAPACCRRAACRVFPTRAVPAALTQGAVGRPLRSLRAPFLWGICAANGRKASARVRVLSLCGPPALVAAAWPGGVSLPLVPPLYS